MSIDFSRRFILRGGATAAAALAAAACQTPAKQAEVLGAFPAAKVGETPLFGPADHITLLGRNENPYGPSKSAIKMMEKAAVKGAYYQDIAQDTLAAMIAERHGVDANQIAITTGSAEALCAIALVYGRKGPIIAPRLFWDTTALYAQNLGLATIDRVALKPDMSIDLGALEAKVTSQSGLVQICNPNNPTGLVYDPIALKASVKRMSKKTTVLVDEAYIELADSPEKNSCVGLIKEGHDVIVARTFSKIYGMAGLRVGYTISAPDTAAKIQAASMSWISSAGLAAAIGAYNDMAFLEYSKSKIEEGKDMVMTTLDSLGMDYLPSSTNFIYFKSGKPANDVHAALKARDIIIRPQYMDYADWSRVSMGKIADVHTFCKALPQVMEA